MDSTAETIIKTFEYKLYRNRAFEAAAQKALDGSRFVYNCALEHRIMRYRQGKPVGFVEQCRELTEARTLPEVGACHRKIQEDALRQLDLAFVSFFKRVHTGSAPGFPRFKGRERYRTFSRAIDARRPCPLTDDILSVGGVGFCRLRLSRPIEGKIKQLRVTHKADGWFVCLVCELPKPAPLPKTGLSVGVDVGLTSFATLSNGEQIDNPRHLRRVAKALKRSQQALSRKHKHSANRAKARRRHALKHLKVRRSRLDFHHKAALNLIERFDRIVVEDLNINEMMHGRLAASISDAGWGQFLCITQSKAAWAGRTCEKVASQYTSQTCSACAHRQKMPLFERVFQCESCGHTASRDLNAAINILGRGAPVKPAERLNQMPRRNRNRHAGKPRT